jgi:hypothetical protein
MNMHYSFVLPALLFFGIVAPSQATMLAPELKAYDFGEAYYIEDGGVVISPYDHGFYCRNGIETPEGIRIMPGGTFMQFDAGRMVVDKYKLTHLNAAGTRAYFHESSYRYKVVKDAHGNYHDVIEQLVGTDDFFLTEFRSWEWLDHAFPNFEVHPGAQGWRTKRQN